jgi:hypothetical protein
VGTSASCEAPWRVTVTGTRMHDALQLETYADVTRTVRAEQEECLAVDDGGMMDTYVALLGGSFTAATHLPNKSVLRFPVDYVA